MGSRRFVSIDPGVRLCGLAAWIDGKLHYARLDSCIAYWSSDWALAIEKPQVYVQSKLKGDPNDLIDLAIAVGKISTRFSEVVMYRPAQWKGQVPKDIMTERIKLKLSNRELDLVDLPAKSLQHNVWDAIGIGLHHLKVTGVRK